MAWGVGNKKISIPKLGQKARNFIANPFRYWYGWEPVGVGDFNGNGRSDILWKHTATGQYFVQLINAKAVAASGIVTGLPANYDVLTVGDFNGDTRSEVYLRRKGAVVSETLIAFFDATGLVISALQAPVGLTPIWANYIVPFKQARPTNATGRASIILRGQQSSTQSEVQDYVACFNADGFTLTPEAAGTSGFMRDVTNVWRMAANGDYNADGNFDIFWQQDNSAANAIATEGIASGDTYIYPLTGRDIGATEGLSRQVVDIPNWKVVGTGQFDAVLGWDILWRQAKPQVGTEYFYIYTLDNAGIASPFVTTNEGYISGGENYFGFDIIASGMNMDAGGHTRDLLFWNPATRVCKIGTLTFAFVGTGAVNGSIDAGTVIPTPT